MAERQYSRVRRYGKRRFRYNYKHHTLEWIDKNNTVIDEIGLSKANWEESPSHWAEQYSEWIDEELSYMARGEI